MTVRPATNLLVGALMRKAEAEGGFAALLCKGDENSGSVLVVLIEKGTHPRLYERLLGPDGSYSWQPTLVPQADNLREVDEFIARRRRFDPDVWAIELDVGSAEEFAIAMNSIG